MNPPLYSIGQSVSILSPKAMKGITGKISEVDTSGKRSKRNAYYRIKLDTPYRIEAGADLNEIGRHETEISPP